MKNKITYIALSVGLLFSSCDDLLTFDAPGVTTVDDFFISGEMAEQAATAAYVPLMWEFGESTFAPEWFIGDVVSDDAIKGGQNIGDMSVVYDMENFKTQSSNDYLYAYYKAQFEGISRANLVIEQVPLMQNDTSKNSNLKTRAMAEAQFLRAYYYFRLARLFGGVPKIDYYIKAQSEWKKPRASLDSIYYLIQDDLKKSIPVLPLKSKYESKDLGRATKGAAQALYMKVLMTQHQYAAAKVWGDSIINSGEYNLCPAYADNFTLGGENGIESVFEVQYTDDATSDYGDGFGFTVGTFTTILTRSRNNAAGGWGFNHPSQELYNEYETFSAKADPRRDITIINPTDDEITNPAEEIYLGNRFLNRKYAMMTADDKYISLSHPTRAPINRKEIRYSDILLMYAEACCETNNLDRAKWALEKVRNRARGGDASILPAFPYGNYRDNKEDLIKAIRHERRVELGMEGHRWFDLIRWGIAAKTMNAYRENASPQIKQHMSPFVEGKHELFPIPLKEIEKNPMPQNNGY